MYIYIYINTYTRRGVLNWWCPKIIQVLQGLNIETSGLGGSQPPWVGANLNLKKKRCLLGLVEPQ